MQTHRTRQANSRDVNASGHYVLYWMQAFRRLHSNHALDCALRWSRELNKPLVVYEGLKRDYPWANARHHAFMLDGMRDNAAAAEKLGLAYWPFVETPENSGRGLVRRLAEDAALIVTDDYPAFIVPAHNRALAKCSVPVHLVDGNSLVPLSLLGPAASAAAHLRHRIHANFAEAWRNRSAVEPEIPKAAKSTLEPPFPAWAGDAAAAEVDPSVAPVPGVRGGSVAGRAVLAEFIAKKLPRYAEHRNDPDDPADGAASRLSPYLRHGHLSIQEVAEATLGEAWTPAEIDAKCKGKREGFYTRDPNAGSFLDEAITWRDTGYHWHSARNAEYGSGTVSWHAESGTPQFNFETFDFSPLKKRTLEVMLPEWAKATLRKHVSDKREFIYTLEEFEAAATHDDLWNAAQRELVRTGRIHNYLRMLWGKKVLEWSPTPSDAYRVLEHLNNKYAIDGRDPNSYTGILWCFGLFDRPWFERDVFGSVRYMSSGNTAKKFDLDGYLRYVNGLK
jgi:deoxyribodipyrimidine photo-lyase